MDISFLVDVPQFYTYLHCRPDGTPFYVGKGCLQYKKTNHAKRSHNFMAGRNKYHKNIVAKYGAENIGVFVFFCDSEEEAFADEIQQIAQLRLEGYVLANICSGGEGRSGFKHTQETIAKMSAAHKGKPNGRLGYKHSPETRAKMSASGKGKIISESQRAKVSAFHKGRKLTDEHKAKVGAAFRGKPWSAARRAAHKGGAWSTARREAQNRKGG
jgi:hypothetical protein